MKKILLTLILIFITFSGVIAQTEPTNTPRPTRFGSSTYFKYCQTDAPTNPFQGQMYLDCDDNKVYQYYGAAWIWMLDGGGGGTTYFGGTNITLATNTFNLDDAIDVSTSVTTPNLLSPFGGGITFTSGIGSSVINLEAVGTGSSTLTIDGTQSELRYDGSKMYLNGTTIASIVNPKEAVTLEKLQDYVTNNSSTNSATLLPIITDTNITQTDIENGVIVHSTTNANTVTLQTMALDYTGNQGWFSLVKNSSDATLTIEDAVGVTLQDINGATITSYAIPTNTTATFISIADDVWRVFRDYPSSGNTYESISESGTQAGLDIVVSIGDHTGNGNGTTLEINDSASEIGTGSTFYVQDLEVRGSANAIIGANNLTANINLEAPNKTAGTYTIATTDDISGGGLSSTDIDTLAELNAIITDATLVDTGHTHTASDVTDFDTEVSNNASVTANTAKISYTDAAAVTANTAKESYEYSTATGTTIDMSKLAQDNFGAASAATTFTMVNIAVGGYAEVLINGTTEPTVTGATKFPNTASWITGTDMILCVKDFNGTRKFWFVEF